MIGSGRGWARLGTLAMGAMALAGSAKAASYESPGYTVTTEHDGFEVREYAPRVEARVRVAGSYDTAINQGFRILAGYIFGGNQGRSKIEMTVPVTTSPGEQIEMTSPVTATSSATDSPMEARAWTVTFMMPSRFTLGTLPVPNDDRIELIETAPERMAVRTFSGYANAARAVRQLDALVAALAEAGLTPVGEPRVAQFDGPWVLGPLRTNEVLVPIAP